MEKTGQLDHGLLSASIRASLSRDEYRKMASNLNLKDYNLQFYEIEGPDYTTLTLVRWLITKP